MPSLDIVIPVFGRLSTLELTLQSVVTQTIPFGWRIALTIIDDGSTGDTEAVVARIPIPEQAWQSIRVMHIPHSGAAAARQTGIKAGQAELILLLGADIILRPGALAQHIAFHDRHPSPQDAALGMVTWNPLLAPTPLMEWMIHGGPQNDFDSLLGQTTADPSQYFYASHVSLKRALLAGVEVRTQYQGYGWEDLDLGAQVATKGAVLHILHQAVGLHHHSYSVRDIINRQRAVGRNYTLFTDLNKKSGTLVLTPARKIKVAILYLSGLGYLLRVVTQVVGGKTSLPNLFTWLTSYEFWRGLWGKQREREVTQ